MNVRMHYLSLLHSSFTKDLGFVPTHRSIGKSLEEWVLFRKYWNDGEDVDALAAGIGVPRDEIIIFIRGWVGERFLTMRKRLRVQDAGELLLSRPEMSMADIARTVGFQDKSDFRHAFTDEKGMSPRLWRECKGSRILFRIRKIREAGKNRCP